MKVTIRLAPEWMAAAAAVAVVRIGEVDRRNQILESGDQTVPDMGIHQMTCPVQLVLG